MTPSELIAVFARRYPRVEVPPAFFTFLKDQEANGHIIRRAQSGPTLTDYVTALGVAPDSFRGLFDSQSHLVTRLDWPQLLTMPARELDTFLRERFATVFSLQETVLDAETLTGFNRHGREHLRAVTRRLLMLLHTATLPLGDIEHLEKEAIIAGYMHDIGNLLSRKDHGIYGLYLMTQFFCGIDHDAVTLASFLRVLEAVLFHEVDFGSRAPKLSDLSPITLSLIIADKTDVSFRRVSDKSNVSEAIEDAHMLVNLLTADSRIQCRKTGFQWEIHFSPTMRNGESSRFSALLKRAERVWVPDEWQRLYRRENIEYVFIFNATFLRLYLKRLAFAVRAVFALNPRVQTFQLVIQDDERGLSLNRRFSRADYEAKLSLISSNIYKNHVTNTPTGTSASG